MFYFKHGRVACYDNDNCSEPGLSFEIIGVHEDEHGNLSLQIIRDNGTIARLPKIAWPIVRYYWDNS